MNHEEQPFLNHLNKQLWAAAQEADAEPFEGKMARLTVALGDQFRTSVGLKAEIHKNLAGLGYAR